METVEASRPSAALPPINFLDVEKIKRDETAEYQRKPTAPSAVSPSFPQSRPPDSYGHPATTGAAPAAPPAALSGLISPPESRRTSGDEEERPVPAKQSLPSIHEALGAEQPLSYPTSAPSAAATTAASQYYQSHATSSPADAHRRSFAEGAAHPAPYGQQSTRSPYMSQPSAAAGAAPQSSNPPPPEPPSRASFASAHNQKLPTLHPLQTGQSPVDQNRPPQPGYPYPPQQQGQQASPAYEQAPHSAGPMNPQYGHSHPGAYPQYPYSAPPPPPPGAGAAYPPPHSQPYAASPQYPPRWREGPDAGRLDGSKRPGATYGESVKRHLETFDVEYSLNEIAESSRKMIEFAQYYGQRAHQTQRTGPVPGSLPSVRELDDYTSLARNVQDSLFRIREMALAQQTALEAQSQRPPYKDVNGYDAPPQGAQIYPDGDQKPAFGGDLTKKRRTRAAPPGRCHSCKRSETPEWRRGPDGARTLCNACGLHYAKLTRKVGGKANIGSSNLRPKNMGNGDAPS